jgi:hypothetical protein
MFISVLILITLACQAITGADESETVTTTEEVNADAAEVDSSAAASDATAEDESVDTGDTDAVTEETAADTSGSDADAAEPASTEAGEAEAEDDSAEGEDGESADAEGDDGDSTDAEGESGEGQEQDTITSGESVAGAASGEGWGESGTTAQTACDYPYLPLRPGATWDYTTSEGPLHWEVTDVQGDMDSATAVLQITVDDVTLDYNWTCAAGEGLTSFDFGNVGVGQPGVEMTIEHTSAEGNFLPPVDDLQAGTTWVTNLESTIQFSVEAEGETMEATGDMTTVQTSTVLGTDPVTVDGQTVDGVQLEQNSAVVMVMNMMGQAIDQNMTIVNTLNLGRGIGIVTQTSITDFGTDTTELVSYFIP